MNASHCAFLAGRQQAMMIGGARTVVARCPARQHTRPRQHRLSAQSTAVQIQELGNITSANGLARTGSNKFNHLQPLEVCMETLTRQNEELASRNATLEMRNAALEKSNADLMTQHRNDVIRNHAMEKEVTDLVKQIGAAADRMVLLEKENEEGGVMDIKSMWYSFTDRTMRLRSVEDKLEEARYQKRCEVAAAREDAQRARAEAARQRASAELMALLAVRVMQACKPLEGC